jgi:hypothetical protein
MRAALYIAKNYKDVENDRIIEILKMRVKVIRQDIEKVDIHIVEAYQGVVERKKITSLYFNNLGQLSFSKCASKGLDVSNVKEY